MTIAAAMMVSLGTRLSSVMVISYESVSENCPDIVQMTFPSRSEISYRCGTSRPNGTRFCSAVAVALLEEIAASFATVSPSRIVQLSWDIDQP